MSATNFSKYFNQQRELEDRWLYSAERVNGVSVEEYVYNNIELGVDADRELAEATANERTDAWLSKKFKEDDYRNKKHYRAEKECSVEESEKYFEQLHENYDPYTIEAVIAQLCDVERFRYAAWQNKKVEEEMDKITGDSHEMLTFGPLDPDAEQARDEIQMAVDPGHYKGVACGKEYMELMVEMLADHSGVEAHLLGQVYKYSMRLGKKDAKEQDAKKIAWYAAALAQYYKHGDIDAKAVSKIIAQI